MIQTATLVAISVQELRRLITHLQTARPPDLSFRWMWLRPRQCGFAHREGKAFRPSPPSGRRFEVLPRRWVVERTFGWMTRWRRLVRDYEERIDCSQAMIHVALGSILLRRIAHQ